MSVQFFNGATISVPEFLVVQGGSRRRLTLGVRWGLLDHAQWGPVLIDTGYTRRATAGPGRSAALRAYSRTLGPVLLEAGQPAAVLKAAGIAPGDVRLVVVTHLHADHVAGLRDFPEARFLTMGAALRERLTGWNAIRHGIFAELLPDDFAARVMDLAALPVGPLPFGLGAGHDVFGDGSCFSVSLPGHTTQHVGLFWPGEAPLLYAVDATWVGAALDRAPTWGARLVADDAAALVQSLAKVRAARDAGCRVVLCHEVVA